MILNQPTPSCQKAINEFDRHEHIVRDVVLTAQAEARSRDEAEPWVKRGVANHDNGAHPDCTDSIETGTREP